MVLELVPRDDVITYCITYCDNILRLFTNALFLSHFGFFSKEQFPS